MIEEKGILTEAIQNTYMQMTYFSAESYGKLVSEETNYTLVDCGLPLSSDNHVLSLGIHGLPTLAEIKKIIAYYKKRKLPFKWWVYPDCAYQQEIEKMLVSTGFIPKEHCASMHLLLDEYHIASEELPEEYRIECVKNEDEMRDFAKVLASTSNPLNASVITFYNDIKGLFLHPESPFSLYVLYVSNVPVSTAMCLHQNDTMGLYSVATHPDHRSKGYAKRITEYTLKLAKELTCKQMILQATPQGDALYRKLGFQQKGMFYAYQLKK